MNPYKQLRQELKKSQAQIADLAGCGITVVKKTEYGMFLAPPPTVTRALLRLDPYGSSDLLEPYYVWQKEERQINRDLFRGRPTDTFSRFRTSIGPAYRFCRLLAYDLGMLQHYESDGSRGEKLFSALSEVMLPAEYDDLRERSY